MSQQEDVLSLEDSGSEYFDTAEAGSSADEMRVPNTSLTALCLLPGMPVATRADKFSHGLFLFLCYPYTFTMIPFFALVAPDHELPSVWFLTNTIKLLISIPTLI
jgi:hypothetical protein